MNKTAIQKYAIWARTEMIAQVEQRAYQYGINKDGYGEENAVTEVAYNCASNQRNNHVQNNIKLSSPHRKPPYIFT